MESDNPCLLTDTDDYAFTNIKPEPPLDDYNNSSSVNDPLHIDFVISVKLEDLEPEMPPPSLSRCINCGVDVTERRKHSLNLAEVQVIIRQWIAPQTVDNNSIICHSCWTLALQKPYEPNMEQPSSNTSRHRQLCVNCGTSLLRSRSHSLHTDSERETAIRQMIKEWITPRQIRGSDRICHPCWQRSDRAASRPSEVQDTSRITDQPTIILPNLTRAPDTQARCFFPECDSVERLRIPMWLRVKLFTDSKFYVPDTCRICRFHLQNDNWRELETDQQPIHNFTAIFKILLHL